MKYTLEGTCDCPRDLYIQYLFQPEHMREWQKSLVDHQLLSGIPGQSGSKNRLTHLYGKRRVEMVETVENSQLPESLSATYEAPGAWNRVVFQFSDTTSGGTRWKMASEFRCTGMLRIMTILVPGMFRRTSQKEMDSLKNYAVANAKGDAT